MKSLQSYTVVISPDDNNTFFAYIPAIKSCHAWGKSADEAWKELASVFDMIQEEYEEEGRFLPENVDIVVA